MSTPVDRVRDGNGDDVTVLKLNQTSVIGLTSPAVEITTSDANKVTRERSAQDARRGVSVLSQEPHCTKNRLASSLHDISTCASVPIKLPRPAGYMES